MKKSDTKSPFGVSVINLIKIKDTTGCSMMDAQQALSASMGNSDIAILKLRRERKS